jgi:hypothetical protein
MTIIAAAESHKIFASRNLVVSGDGGYAGYGYSQCRCNNPLHLVTSPSGVV